MDILTSCLIKQTIGKHNTSPSKCVLTILATSLNFVPTFFTQFDCLETACPEFFSFRRASPLHSPTVHEKRGWICSNSLGCRWRETLRREPRNASLAQSRSRDEADDLDPGAKVCLLSGQGGCKTTLHLRDVILGIWHTTPPLFDVKYTQLSSSKWSSLIKHAKDF